MSAPAAMPRPRMNWLDALRGIALVAMAIYHFGWDLDLFGYVPHGSASTGAWKMFARVIANSFLILVGVGIVLAHTNGIRWTRFWRRWAMIAAAAAVITIGTYFIFPDAYIFFGILHHIAFASLFGLLFLPLHPVFLILLAVASFFMSDWVTASWLSQPWLNWTGLSGLPVRSNDFVPVFPWFASVLIGMALAKTARILKLSAPDWADRLAQAVPGRWLAFLGRHSLATYLIHQPVLLGLVWLASQVAPPTMDIEAETRNFITSCEANCAAEAEQPLCIAFCACVVRDFGEAGLLNDVLAGRSNPNEGAAGDIVAACTVEMSDGPAAPQ